MSICDFHLARASCKPTSDQRDIGNRLLNSAEQAAAEWKNTVDEFLPRDADLGALPEGSWLLEIGFTLTRPFTSRSEVEFHPWKERVDKKKGSTVPFELQNPIVRDHLTGLPTVKPTTWKGHLAFAAAAEGLDVRIRERLFGTIRANESGQEGRLHFFPTFFQDKTTREVVTPLHRDTRTPARGPIDLEVVGAGQHGKLCLLYVPRPRGRDWGPGQVAEDLEVAARAVKAMLLNYGFSAKKTSGWGVAADSLVAGRLAAKGRMWPEATTALKPQFVEPEEAFRKFMDAEGRSNPALKKPTAQWLSNQEYKNSGLALGSLSEYKKFRTWYDSHGQEWVRRMAGLTAARKSELRIYTFPTLGALVELAERLTRSARETTGV